MGAFQPTRLARSLAAPSHRTAAPPPRGTIKLTIGDPDFDTPPHIRRAMVAALESGATHYADWSGDPELRAAIADLVVRRSGRPCAASQVVLTHGGNAALTASILATVHPGDRVLIPSPTYPPYGMVVRGAGGEAVPVPHTGEMRLDLDAIDRAAPGARMIIVCNPCNPTGAVHSRAELEELARIARRHDVLVLSDEAYDGIVFDGVTFTPSPAVPEFGDRLLYVQTFSKTYAMTGWRLGYVVASEEVAEAVQAVHRGFNGALNTAVQRAGLAAITGPQDEPERMRREYQVRRELALEILHGIPGVDLRAPEGTFYAFVRHPTGIESTEVRRLALDRGVAIRAGSEFGTGGEGHLRISLTAERGILTEGLERLRSLFHDLADGRPSPQPVERREP